MGLAGLSVSSPALGRILSYLSVAPETVASWSRKFQLLVKSFGKNVHLKEMIAKNI